MKECRYCKKTIDENAIFCSYCGARAGEGSFNGFGGRDSGFNNGPFYSYSRPSVDHSGSFGLAILGFFFWQVGFILWLVMRRTRPGKAKSAAMGSLVGVSVRNPLVGLVTRMIFKEENNSDYARACGIGAIIGAAYYAIILLSVIAAWVFGLFA